MTLLNNLGEVKLDIDPQLQAKWESGDLLTPEYIDTQLKIIDLARKQQDNQHELRILRAEAKAIRGQIICTQKQLDQLYIEQHEILFGICKTEETTN